MSERHELSPFLRSIPSQLHLLSASSDDEDHPSRPHLPAKRPGSSEEACVKGPWSQEEDELLLKAVTYYGEKRWSEIACSIPGRKGKVCFSVVDLLRFLIS